MCVCVCVCAQEADTAGLGSRVWACCSSLSHYRCLCQLPRQLQQQQHACSQGTGALLARQTPFRLCVRGSSVSSLTLARSEAGWHCTCAAALLCRVGRCELISDQTFSKRVQLQAARTAGHQAAGGRFCG